MAHGRYQARSRQRGAALVEAAVVVGLLVIFWGVLALAYTAGRAKLEAQHESRIGVMYYASHECKQTLGRPQAVVLPNGPAGTFAGSGDSAADRFADQAPLGDSMSARSELFFASVHATASSTLVGRTTVAESTSWAVCNEGVHDGDLFGLFSYAYGVFKGLLPSPIKAIAP